MARGEGPKMVSGDWGEYLKQREAMLPDFQNKIDGILKNYYGEMLVIVRIKEDENGAPVGSQNVVVGGGSPEIQLKLAEQLGEVAEAVIDQMIDAASADPLAMLQLLKIGLDRKLNRE